MVQGSVINDSFVMAFYSTRRNWTVNENSYRANDGISPITYQLASTKLLRANVSWNVSSYK